MIEFASFQNFILSSKIKLKLKKFEKIGILESNWKNDSTSQISIINILKASNYN